MSPRRLAAAALAAGAALLVVPICAGAIAAIAAGGASVTSYTAIAQLGDDGVLHVRERVTFDFAGTPTDGVTRSWSTTQRYPGDRDRIYDLQVRSVGSARTEGTTSELEQSEAVTTVDVGFPEPQSDQVTVTFVYDVDGTLARTPDGLELRWSLVQGFELPVERATATIIGPPLQWLACFAGAAASSRPCTAAMMAETASPELRQDGIPAGGRMTAVLGYGADSALTPNAVFHTRWSFARAFSLTPLSLGLAGLCLLLGALAAGALWWTRGRDRPYNAQLAEARPSALSPPDGIRPGQVGTLVDERADVIDVTATVVDLAVRGYVGVEEVDAGPYARSDWLLCKLRDPVADLLGYEHEVFGALFQGRDSVRVSELGPQLGGRLARVQGRLYDDMVAQGWFGERPDSVRNRWTTAGLVLMGAGVVLTVVLAIATTFALVGLAVVLAGVALALVGQIAPARTARGSRALARLAALRSALAAADASDLPAADRQQVASRLFPYAVVFGLAERWAGTLVAAGNGSPRPISWYAGAPGRPPAELSGSVAGLVAALSGTVVAASRRPLAGSAAQR